MSNSERRNYYNRRFGSTPPRPMTQAEKDLLDAIPTFAGQALTIENIVIKTLVFAATVKAPDGTKFTVNLRTKAERDLFPLAGYTLPVAHGEYPFAATVIGHMVSEHGTVEMRVKSVLHKDTGEPVTFAPVAPQPKLPPLKPMASNVDKKLYKWHGETMTAFSAQEVGHGARKVWKLECRASDESLVRVEAWSEVNRMLKAESYPELPERGAPRTAVNFDVVIEYNDSYKSYRVVHVYPQTQPDIVPDTQPETVADIASQLQAIHGKLMAMGLQGIPQKNAAWFLQEAITRLQSPVSPVDITNDVTEVIPTLDIIETDGSTPLAKAG